MASIINKIRSNYNFAGTALLFVLAFILIGYMLPRERKFTYEFQDGRPWREENLTAPFNFAILKTDAEYTAERDTALKGLKPYYYFDANEFAGQLNAFKENFTKEWLAYSLEKFQISEEEYLKEPRYSVYRDMEHYYDGFLYSLLEKINYKGIVDVNGVERSLSDNDEIVLLRGNIAEEKLLTDIYTLKSAYEYVRAALEEEINKNKSGRLTKYHEFFNNFEIEAYITSNIFYDQQATEREREAIINEISKKKGIIQRGELIVEKGEIINSEIYQILQSLKIAYNDNQRNVNTLLVLVGKLIFVLFALSLIYVFLYNFRRELLRNTLQTTFILFMVVLMVFIASTTARIDRVSFYVIPFTILPIILRTFFDERVAVFIHILTTVVIGLIAPNSYEFIVLNIIAGVVAIFSLTNLYRRSRFFISALLVGMTYISVYIGIHLIHEGSLLNLKTENFGYFGMNSILILISFLLIYVFEKVFGFLSDTSLMELADTNQPLLRKLAEIAPGTFQHSLQVASLSEDAVHRIGGNPLLVRTGALYHDIGKMYDPIYFIENQASGINPHDNLEFEESARVIIDHVQKGVELARKNNLPEPIVDFIRTHHGDSTVQYFYRNYIKKYPQQEVDLKKFSYPGPKPFTKEMAVLMMADSIEAASRSLGDYSMESISELVESIIKTQLKEGQFEEAPITFKDITAVKEVFKIRLKNIYHARISYPKKGA